MSRDRTTTARFDLGDVEIDNGKSAFVDIDPSQTFTVKLKRGGTASMPLWKVARMVLHRVRKIEAQDAGIKVPRPRTRRGR